METVREIEGEIQPGVKNFAFFRQVNLSAGVN